MSPLIIQARPCEPAIPADEACKEALRVARLMGVWVELDFNGVTIIVTPVAVAADVDRRLSRVIARGGKLFIL